MRTIIDKLPGNRLTVSDVMCMRAINSSPPNLDPIVMVKESLSHEMARKIIDMAKFTTYDVKEFPAVAVDLDVIVITPEQLRAELLAMYQKGVADTVESMRL